MRLLTLLILLAACQPTTLADLRVQAAAEAARLSATLHNVDTRDQLEQVFPEVQGRFTRIAKLVEKLRDLDIPLERAEPSPEADALFAELARLYEMPGCRALIERAQEEARGRLLKKETPGAPCEFAELRGL